MISYYLIYVQIVHSAHNTKVPSLCHAFIDCDTEKCPFQSLLRSVILCHIFYVVDKSVYTFCSTCTFQIILYFLFVHAKSCIFRPHGDQCDFIQIIYVNLSLHLFSLTFIIFYHSDTMWCFILVHTV